jgi:hypothetical protein
MIHRAGNRGNQGRAIKDTHDSEASAHAAIEDTHDSGVW